MIEKYGVWTDDGPYLHVRKDSLLEAEAYMETTPPPSGSNFFAMLELWPEETP